MLNDGAWVKMVNDGVYCLMGGNKLIDGLSGWLMGNMNVSGWSLMLHGG